MKTLIMLVSLLFAVGFALCCFRHNACAFDMPKTVEWEGSSYTRNEVYNEYEQVVEHDINGDKQDETIVHFRGDSAQDSPKAFTQIYQTIKGKKVLIKTISNAETPVGLKFVDADKDGVDDIVVFDSCGNHYTTIMIYSFKDGEYKCLFENGTACYVHEVKTGKSPTRVVIGRENWANKDFSYANSDTNSLLEVWEWDGKTFVYAPKLSTSPKMTEAEAVEATWQHMKAAMEQNGEAANADVELLCKAWTSGGRLKDSKTKRVKQGAKE